LYKYILQVICTVPAYLTSIYYLPIEVEFTVTSGGGGLIELVLANIKYVMAPLEVGPEFAFN